MNNPMFNRPDNSNRGFTDILDLLSVVRNSPNPESAMQELVSRDPRLQNVASYIQENGGSAKAAFYDRLR